MQMPGVYNYQDDIVEKQFCSQYIIITEKKVYTCTQTEGGYVRLYSKPQRHHSPVYSLYNCGSLYH